MDLILEHRDSERYLRNRQRPTPHEFGVYLNTKIR